MKTLGRHLSSIGKVVKERKLSALIDDFLDSNAKVTSSVKPKLNGKFVINIDDLTLLIIKIAYELAVHRFDDSYLDDPVATKLSTVLRDQSKDNSLMGIVPTSMDMFGHVFDNSYHWVMFAGGTCYVQLYGICGAIQYSSDEKYEPSRLPLIYRFDYCRRSYEIVPIQNLLMG